MRVMCHIVGMNSLLKSEFMKELEPHTDISVMDLDKIALDIRNDKETGRLYKGQGSKLVQKNWQERIDSAINNFVSQNGGKRIIMIGLSTFNRNHRIKANIPTKNKFFVDIDYKENIKDVIRYNIENHADKIVEGTFPLNYLNYDYLTKQRDKLSKIYSNLGYMPKSMKDIRDWVLSGKDVVYVGSRAKHDMIIPINKKPVLGGGAKAIIGYPTKWLALVSAVPNSKEILEKGIARKETDSFLYVKEKTPKVFDSLHIPAFIYSVEKDSFGTAVRYKMRSTKPLKYTSVETVDNIYNYLVENGVHMIECD